MDQSPTTARAAIVRSKGARFVIEDVRILPPRSDEVLIRVVATGVCHTDLIVRDQYYPVPLPSVLGHEGAGIVEAVGENVSSLARGDHVVLTFMSCGNCHPCQRGEPSYCSQFYGLNLGGGYNDRQTATADTHGATIHDHF